MCVCVRTCVCVYVRVPGGHAHGPLCSLWGVREVHGHGYASVFVIDFSVLIFFLQTKLHPPLKAHGDACSSCDEPHGHGGGTDLGL